MRKTTLLVLLLCSVSASAQTHTSAAKFEHHAWAAKLKAIRPTGVIPQGYQTYSLFLICNPQWIGPEGFYDLKSLYFNFEDFGQTIGDDNLAIWFIKASTSYTKDGQHQYSTLSVDVERNIRFCKAWHLVPSNGPYVVITSTYPDESHLSQGIPENNAVFALGNMDRSEIASLLTGLTDQLLFSSKVPIPKNQIDSKVTIPQDSLWSELLKAVQKSIRDFGCKWDFTVNAGPVQGHVQPCQKKS